jgi:8-oxo-dGTP diphosphatase
MMELWDAYDEHFNKVKGVTLVRGEDIPEGLYHLICNILICHKDGTYLLMRRDYTKEWKGGFWQASVGGSALQGETPIECARREVREETGIESGDFQEVVRDSSAERRTHYVEYLCVTDVPKDSITFQEGETVEYKWVSREELLSMDDSTLVPFHEKMHGVII